MSGLTHGMGGLLGDTARGAALAEQLEWPRQLPQRVKRTHALVAGVLGSCSPLFLAMNGGKEKKKNTRSESASSRTPAMRVCEVLEFQNC
eukprot:284637-Rhodomonas_salina.3